MKKDAGYFASRESLDKYIKWRRDRSSSTLKIIQKKISLKGQKILDVGCGYGAFSFEIAKKGGQVIGVDSCEQSLKIAKKYHSHSGTKFVKMNAEKLSFSDASFDLVIMFDVLEHVTNPEKAIDESWRVLKKKGFLYVEYCPYYSLIGHHLYDYTLLPVQFFPKRFTEWLILSKGPRGLSTPQEALKEFYALNKITVRKFKKLIIGKEIVDEQYIIKYPGVFRLNLKFLKYLGWFKELLTFTHIVFLKRTN